jgi:hypothetical protein
VIRNVVIHLQGEQPLVADLEHLPTASDTSLICTNVRHVDGKKPRFVDHTESTFVFPLTHIRFLEVPPGGAPGNEFQLSAGALDDEPEELLDLEPDEDFLRRIRDA